MQEILASLNESVISFIQSIKDTANALYAEANKRKADLDIALTNMQEANDCLLDFSTALAPLEEITEISCIAAEAAEYVSEMIEDMYVFDAPIEEFDGYCDSCGEELLRSSPLYINESNAYICEDCDADLHDTEEETWDEEGSGESECLDN